MNWILYASVLLLLIPIGSGLIVALDPYVLAPTQVIKRTSLWGDPAQQPALVIFTISSRGALTANYPIHVEVEVKKSKDVEVYFSKAETMEMAVVGSYQYPVKQGKDMFGVGIIPISVESGRGSGTMVFPYAGSFSVYTIFVDGQPVFMANFPEQREDPIFVIEDYGLRLQIEASRNMGIAIVSVSLTAMSLILAREGKPSKSKR
jgi:hypothetical protein